MADPIILPKLPHPVMNAMLGDDWADLFTADQLRAHAAAVSAAKDAEIAGLRAELFAHQVYIRVLCKAVDAATDFAGTVAGGASWWDDVWDEHFRALDAARAELIKSLADNAALRADAIDRQNNGDRYEPLPPVRLWRTAP